MGNRLTEWVVLAIMLCGLPAAGVAVSGRPLEPYLEFPPETLYVQPAPFSWFAFWAYALFIALVAAPIAVRLWKGRMAPPTRPAAPFPWWGWAGLAAGLLFWTLAWTRFAEFAPLQPHTFAPLWLSYILVVNAAAQRRDGHCLMMDRPGFFIALFPFSAAFWWFFEYLNRFVQNWVYSGAEYDAATYFLLASLSFSTVLPAVLSTREWVAGFPALDTGFGNVRPIRPERPRLVAAVVLLLSGAGLLGIGLMPNLLFPLLWISPLLIIASVRVLLGKRQVFSPVAVGDWRPIIASAMAALVCGLFWEMWNFYSLARWEYRVPLVHRFEVFEMPILGYAGYLPFGLECAAVGQMIAEWFPGPDPTGEKP